MNTLDAYCINLKRRDDRWRESQDNFAKCQLPPGFIKRWQATEDRQFGALGCAKSHLALLSHFLCATATDLCMVLEDDFDFVRPWPELLDLLRDIQRTAQNWDVLLLAGTTVVTERPNAIGLSRVTHAQSTAGYIVGRRYAARLIASFADSVASLERMKGHVPNNFAAALAAIDMNWKPLQRADDWYIPNPPFGIQRPSYSDIVNKHVDYGTLSYGAKNT